MMNSTQVSTDSVRAFYDDFLKSRMLDYRLDRNLRIERAIERAIAYVRSDSTILDVGCGIGIVAERLARSASRGRVYACDLSEQNIWYAGQTVTLPNVSFKAIDALHDFDSIRSWVSSPVDLIVMVDVLEHLPVEEHPQLFRSLRGLMARQGTIVLTFPSPAYQRYLRANDRGELQIVDEIIELEYVVSLCSDAGLFVKHYSVEDVWMANQYTHCVLQAAGEVGPISQARTAPFRRAISGVARRVDGAWRKRILRPLLRRKYVDRVFRER